MLATAALLLSACDTAPSASADSSAPAASAGVDPEELVVSFVPSSEAAARAEDIEPLPAYLAEQLDMPVTGTVSSNDASLVSGIQAGQVHIGALALIAYAATDAGVEVLDAIYQITALTEPNLEALQIVRQAVDELGYEG